MSSDYEEGLQRGQRALQLAEESGAAAIKRATLSNIGNLFYRTGHFAEAIDYFRRALSCLPTHGDRTNGARESLARVYLVQQDFDQAGVHLQAIEDSVRNDADWVLYANRHSKLTQAELHARKGNTEPAMLACEQAIRLAARTGDTILEVTASLLKAEVLVAASFPERAATVLSEVSESFGKLPHDVLVQYERVLACGLLSVGCSSVVTHLERAKRISAGLHSIPAQLEVDRLAQSLRAPDRSESSPLASQGASTALQDVAALMLHAGKPELLATDIIALLANADCVHAAVAQSRGDDGRVEILAAYQPAPQGESTPSRTLTLGQSRGRTVELLVSPRRELEATATLNALTLLLGSVRDLEQAHTERGATLRPVADRRGASRYPSGGPQRTDARAHDARAARRPHQRRVLITGESGTGKEILARAIHAILRARNARSSPSTARPFRARCSKASCSATAAAPSPAPIATTRASSAPPRTARCSSTRSASSASTCSPSCCASSSRARSTRSASPARSTSTSASSPPPTRTSSSWSRKAGSAKISSTA